jgi:hypothetical protein
MPGLFKIYDEVPVNAVDHAARPQLRTEHPVPHQDVARTGRYQCGTMGTGYDVHPPTTTWWCPELRPPPADVHNHNDGEARRGRDDRAKAANIYLARFLQ